MKKTIQEVSQETLKIEHTLKTIGGGIRISYKEIEERTGVKMDARGKGFLRSAARRMKMPYVTYKGEAIELLSPENAKFIVGHSVVKIDNSVKRAERTTKSVRGQVYERLPENERKTIDVLSALFGSIRAFSTSAKQLFSKPVPRVGDTIK